MHVKVLVLMGRVFSQSRVLWKAPFNVLLLQGPVSGHIETASVGGVLGCAGFLANDWLVG